MKKAVIMCTCRYVSPEMSRIDFNELSDRLHREFPNERFLLHPELCEETGKRMKNELKDDDVFYITPACSIEEQHQKLRDVFELSGIVLTRSNWNPVSLSGLSTEAAFQVIRDAILSEPHQ